MISDMRSQRRRNSFVWVRLTVFFFVNDGSGNACYITVQRITVQLKKNEMSVSRRPTLDETPVKVCCRLTVTQQYYESLTEKMKCVKFSTNTNNLILS